MMLLSRELSLLTTRNSMIPFFSSTTAGLSGNVIGLGESSAGDSICFRLGRSTTDDLRGPRPSRVYVPRQPRGGMRHRRRNVHFPVLWSHFELANRCAPS